MHTPLQITYRGMEPSDWLNEEIELQLAKLEHYSPRLTSCRVVLEQPHRHHRKGRGFKVEVELVANDREILGTATPRPADGPMAARVAVHAAFESARRQLVEGRRRRVELARMVQPMHAH